MTYFYSLLPAILFSPSVGVNFSHLSHLGVVSAGLRTNPHLSIKHSLVDSAATGFSKRSMIIYTLNSWEWIFHSCPLWDVSKLLFAASSPFLRAFTDLLFLCGPSISAYLPAALSVSHEVMVFALMMACAPLSRTNHVLPVSLLATW